jgi:membrane protease YdiL (CAAX protease family)
MPAPTPIPPPAPLNARAIGGAIAGLALLSLGGVVFGGELGSFMGVGLEVLPFMLLAVLAYIGLDRDWGKVMAVIGWMVVSGGYALLALLLSLSAILGNASLQDRAATNAAMQAHGGQLAFIVLGLALAVGIGALGFIPSVRQGAARLLPLDPTSFVHTIALVTVMSVILISVIPLLVLAAPPLLSAVTNASAQGRDLNGNNSEVLGQLYELVWVIPCTIFAVGYGIRRDWRAALERLGLVRPTRRQVLLGLGLAVLAVGVSFGLDWVTNTIWQAAGWPQTDSKAFEKLMAGLLTPIGAIVIGVSAGLGEELAVRGVLQPRLGILMSNVFFTSLHALQYNWDGLLSVFLLGMVLGVLRQRTNTTTSAITHGTYDAILVLLSLGG